MTQSIVTQREHPAPLPRHHREQYFHESGAVRCLFYHCGCLSAFNRTLSVYVCVLSSAIIQKRLKKEKKAKRKLQEALEYECKRREQAEQSLKQSSPTESLRSLNGEAALQCHLKGRHSVLITNSAWETVYWCKALQWSVISVTGITTTHYCFKGEAVNCKFVLFFEIYS